MIEITAVYQVKQQMYCVIHMVGYCPCNYTKYYVLRIRIYIHTYCKLTLLALCNSIPNLINISTALISPPLAA